MEINKKAQGALEYLLMIGAAILVVAIVIIAISGVITQTNDQNAGSTYGDQMGGLKGLILNLSEDPFKTTHNIFQEQSKKNIEIKGITILESKN